MIKWPVIQLSNYFKIDFIDIMVDGFVKFKAHFNSIKR